MGLNIRLETSGLKLMSANIPRAIRQAQGYVGIGASRDLQAVSPVDTGFLRSHWSYASRPFELEIGNPTTYAAYRNHSMPRNFEAYQPRLDRLWFETLSDAVRQELT